MSTREYIERLQERARKFGLKRERQSLEALKIWKETNDSN